MIRLRHKMLISATRVVDQAALVVIALAVIYQRPGFSVSRLDTTTQGSTNHTLSLLILLAGWIAIYDYCIRYKGDRLVALSIQMKNLVKATTLSSFWFVIVSVLFSIENMDTKSVAVFWVSITVLGVILRLSLKAVLMNARRSGYNYRYLLVVGANPFSADFTQKITSRAELGYKIVGFVAESPESKQAWQDSGNTLPILGMVDDILSILEREKVDEMLVCLSVEAKFSTVTQIISHARDLGIVVRIVPEASELSVLKKLHIEEFENHIVATFFREQMLLQLLVKRVMDISISASALLILSPVLAIIALLIKLNSPGPIFFGQDRVGMNQRRFRLFKFRSMVENADLLKKDLAHLNELDGPAFKIENDPRVTSIGRFIRKTSLDELPQLFNVLKGEMSLVGPRPPLPAEVSQYQWLFRRRLSVKPGITCLWQIGGRSTTTFDEWMKMDKQYVENWSLWLDLKILFKTIPAVLLCRGAS